jgi:FkbM family methyltransferase
VRLAGDWSGIATAEPDAVEEGLRSKALVAVTRTDQPFGPIARRLAKDGWRNVVPFLDLAESCRERQPVTGGWTSRWLNKKDFARAAAVMERWADGRSRAHHLAFAAWRLRRSDWHFAGAPVSPEDRFLPVDLSHAMTPDERLLDIGAFHGAGLLRFAMRPGRQFGHIWAVEPDATNRAILEATVISHGRALASKVTVLSDVIGATAGPMPFREGLGPWSQVGEAGGEERDAVTVGELGLAPSFITIDVPGAHAVLEGAGETLGRHRPIVAVDVGHDPDGLWKIADRLMTTLENYRFLMRCHGWCGVRSVVYAIPQERAAA